MNHAEIIDILPAALNRLYDDVRRRVVACLVEPGRREGEQPDLYAILDGRDFLTVVCEVKVSPSDFRADKGKRHRRCWSSGVGQERWFVVPVDMVEPREVPPGWGLLYVDDDGMVAPVYVPSRSVLCPDPEARAGASMETMQGLITERAFLLEQFCKLQAARRAESPEAVGKGSSLRPAADAMRSPEAPRGSAGGWIAEVNAVVKGDGEIRLSQLKHRTDVPPSLKTARRMREALERAARRGELECSIVTRSGQTYLEANADEAAA